MGETPRIRLDHCVIHVSEWERSYRFYGDVLGAGWSYSSGDQQLNLHGPGIEAEPLARRPW